jgi:hypothetical protein
MKNDKMENDKMENDKMENLLLAPSVEWLLTVGQTGMSILLSFI